MSSTDSSKRLSMAIVEYLDKAVADGLVSADGAESLEIAKQCVADAFGLNLDDEASVRELTLKPFSLDKVFDVYMATQAKLNTSASNSKAAASAADSQALSAEDRQRADAYKAEGNSFVMQKDYASAIDAYTRAIELVGDTAVYYGNRAAAYSQNGEHEKAVADAKKALEIDPKYSKGYSRLGLAHYSLGQYKEAAEAYEKGLELDPGNSVMTKSLESAKAKITSSDRSAASPDQGSSGGGFDLSSLMNNPALMNMAQSMMANGGLEQLMSNPAIARMAENFRSSGQTPSMSDIMNNPEIMDMARNLSGSAGSAGSGANAGSADAGSSGSSGSGGGSSSSNPLASLMSNPALMDMAKQFMQGGGSRNNTNQ